VSSGESGEWVPIESADPKKAELLDLVQQSNVNLSILNTQLEVVKSWRRLIEIILLKYSEKLQFLQKEVITISMLVVDRLGGRSGNDTCTSNISFPRVPDQR
jgi:hypothetical protein